MIAYYNEIDPFAAAWLRELINAGHIAPGIVDERSIEDVVPAELTIYDQCHFFAGIGVWSYALRQAGWPDDRPVWTGSCPCQPFSSAGKGGGFADERHLWPAFHWLIGQCHPDVVFGEQVAKKNGNAWLDLVSTDMEGCGYACGAVVTAACGFGAPHIRQRLYWVADSDSMRRESIPCTELCSEIKYDAESFSDFGRLVDTFGQRGRGGQSGREDASHVRLAGETDSVEHATGDGRLEEVRPVSEASQSCGLADAKREGLPRRGAAQPVAVKSGGSPVSPDRPGPTNGFWRAADWLQCRDGKWRPAQPGTFPLAHGAPARVGRLRGYGNAVNAAQAAAFVEAYLEREYIDVEKQ